MPIKQCSIKGKSGYKFGDNGRCYTGENAKARAEEQGRAIKASQHNAVRKSKRKS